MYFEFTGIHAENVTFVPMKAIAITLFLLGLLQAQAPTDLDSLLKSNEHPLPKIDLKHRNPEKDLGRIISSTSKEKLPAGLFVLQFDALADFDAAQRRREELQRRTGYGIQLVFDAPFYKLRGGSWTTREEAEDKVRELAENRISAFVVKLR